MQPIPLAIRKRLANDPQMLRCIAINENGEQCSKQEVEWEHPFTGMGWKQINKWWSIAPLCYDHHRGSKRTKHIQQQAQLWCINRGGNEPTQQYPKTDWVQLKKYLECQKHNWSKPV